MARAKTNTEVETASVVAFKGFDADLRCRDFQYRIGETFEHKGTVKQCSSGFHVCANPLDVLDYYPLIGESGQLNRFARVTIGGKIDRSDNKKWAAAEITINAELTIPDFIKTAVGWIMDAAKIGATVDTGYSSQLAASGNSSQLAASGDSSKLAASGDSSKLAASGDSSKLAASGNYSQLAASGYSSKLAASGNSSQLAASGNYSKLAASGNYSQLAASGYYSQLAASGDSSKLAASGNSSQLAASGNSSQLEITGSKSAAAAVGPGSSIKAAAGTPIAICEYDSAGSPVGFATGIAGQDGIPADTWLIARDGKLVEAVQ